VEAVQQVTGPVLVIATLVVFVIEGLIPLAHDETASRTTHALRNIGGGLAAFVVFAALGPALVLLAVGLEAHDVGLLHLSGLPSTAQVVAGVVLFDLVDYWRHRAAHAIPVLWRLHRVHHSDPAMDVTTWLRVHPAELPAIALFHAAGIALFGIGPLAVVIRALVNVCTQILQHANVRLPLALDRGLSWFTPTPRVHRVHHARDQEQTDSNFGLNWTVWDRLFGTFRQPGDAAAIRTGLDGSDGPEHQTVTGLYASPFRDFAP
jgi:sterol desaturase/sphingolipid hydroxylase (fatty acid hydroxylase superfamily)